MTQDAKLSALFADVRDARERLAALQDTEPDHVVALAMYEADVKRAVARVNEYLVHHPGRVRRYEQGHRVA